MMHDVNDITKLDPKLLDDSDLKGLIEQLLLEEGNSRNSFIYRHFRVGEALRLARLELATREGAEQPAQG